MCLYLVVSFPFFFFWLLISFFRLCGKSLSCLKISRTKLSGKKKKSPLLSLHSHEQINRLKKSSLSRERAGQGLIPQLKSALRPQKELFIVSHLAENMRWLRLMMTLQITLNVLFSSNWKALCHKRHVERKWDESMLITCFWQFEKADIHEFHL